MKITIICKSDSTGGAAIASFRLMQALRSVGEDARMLVVEKKTDSPYVEAVGGLRYKFVFLAERFKIFFKNGFNRKTLFQIDTGSAGLPLYHHKLIKDADAVLLQWVNQGMLSINGIGKICALGKKVLWTMHDMWPFTGTCHHAGFCSHYLQSCGSCHLLHKENLKPRPHDLSNKIWRRKKKLYASGDIKFVAVSSWVREKAESSSLLSDQNVSVIPNPFPPVECDERDSHSDHKIIFGAARLDDPIKGLETLIRTLNFIADTYPDEASGLEVLLFGSVRNPDLLNSLKVKWNYVGEIEGLENIRQLYQDADVVVSSSHFETSGNTLVEGQAFGCVPVSFNRGGQKDIIDHLSTGYLAQWDDDLETRSRNLAEGVRWALAQGYEARRKMRENVKEKFSYSSVAKKYLSILNS